MVAKSKRSPVDALSELQALYPRLSFALLGEYSGSRSLYTVTCEKHGTSSKMFRKLVGSGAPVSACVTCTKEASGKQVTFEDYVLRAKSVHGDKFSYLAEGFTGSTGKVSLICPEHGRITTDAYTHLVGHGCPECGYAARSLSRRSNTLEFIAKAVTVHGDTYDYSGTEYISAESYLTIICPVHGEFSQLAATHLDGCGCPACSVSTRALKAVLSFEDFKSKATNVHSGLYTYVEDSYSRSTAPVTIICPTHGEFSQQASQHLDGKGCKLCNTRTSRGECELAEYVQSLGFTPVRNHKLTDGTEIDVYVPELRVGIEYDGLAFHSTLYRPYTKQVKKFKACESDGIRLIRVFEDEWLDKRKCVESILRNSLGIKSESIYARNTKVEEVSYTDAQAFHNTNHIQGWNRYGTSFGLRFGGELVAVMTFTSQVSSRVAEDACELSRFSSSVRVVGGASRLLAHYISRFSPKKVVSFSDKRLFTGEMYKSLGFNLASESPPTYTYWKAGSLERKHKSLFTRSRLIDALGSKFDPALSERENCERNKFYQVFDDGKLRWELHL